MAGYDVTARGAAVAVSMVMEPDYRGSGPVFSSGKSVKLLLFLFGKTHGGNDVEPAAGDQVARQYLLWQVFCHDLSDKPGPPLHQRPRPELVRQTDRPCSLPVGTAHGLHQHVGFRDDVKCHLVKLNIPGRASGPGCGFVIPGPPGSFEIVIPQPCDAPGKSLWLLDLMLLFFCSHIHDQPPLVYPDVIFFNRFSPCFSIRSIVSAAACSLRWDIASARSL